MTTPVIRLATSADSDAILDIYTPYIETPITFEEDAPRAKPFKHARTASWRRTPSWLPSLTGPLWVMPMRTSCASVPLSSGTQSFPCTWHRLRKVIAWAARCTVRLSIRALRRASKLYMAL